MDLQAIQNELIKITRYLSVMGLDFINEDIKSAIVSIKEFRELHENAE